MSDVDSFKQGGWREVSPDSNVEDQEKSERERQEKMEEFMVKSTEELLAELSDVKDGLRTQQERLDRLTQLLEDKLANEQQEKKDDTSDELPTEPLVKVYKSPESEAKKAFEVGDSVKVNGEDDWTITAIRLIDGKKVYDLLKNNHIESGAQVSKLNVSEEELRKWQEDTAEKEDNKEKVFKNGQKVKISANWPKGGDGRVWVVVGGPHENGGSTGYAVQIEIPDKPGEYEQIEVPAEDLEAQEDLDDSTKEVEDTTKHGFEAVVERQEGLHGFQIEDRVMVNGEKGWKIIAIKREHGPNKDDVYTVEKIDGSGEQKDVWVADLEIEPIDDGYGVSGAETGDKTTTGETEKKNETDRSAEVEAKKQILEGMRKKYLAMLRDMQSRLFWKNPSQTEQESIWQSYKEAFADYALVAAENKIDTLHPGLEKAEREQKIREAVIMLKVEEMRQLSSVGAEISAEGKYDKFKKWWTKHKYIRLGIGLGMVAGGFALGPLGAGAGIATGLAIAKGAFSGVGGYVAAESAFELGQGAIENRSGDTKLFNEEQLKELGFDDRIRAMAAQLAKTIETRKDAFSDEKTKALMESLAGGYGDDLEKIVEEDKAKGLNHEQIVAHLLGRKLEAETTASDEALKLRDLEAPDAYMAEEGESDGWARTETSPDAVAFNPEDIVEREDIARKAKSKWRRKLKWAKFGISSAVGIGIGYYVTDRAMDMIKHGDTTPGGNKPGGGGGGGETGPTGPSVREMKGWPGESYGTGGSGEEIAASTYHARNAMGVEQWSQWMEKTNNINVTQNVRRLMTEWADHHGGGRLGGAVRGSFNGESMYWAWRDITQHGWQPGGFK